MKCPRNKQSQYFIVKRIYALIPKKTFSSFKLRKLSLLTSKGNFPPPLPSFVLCKSMSKTAKELQTEAYKLGSFLAGVL